ncbi:MAG: DUF1569 domain-containing protein [Cytophagales bacterium]|nr:MAG: DUF1569 domain-containing protein [Cytophagales bacterium]
MALPSVFEKEVCDNFIARIHLLTPQTQPLWGKMDATKMLAHCNVTYEMVFENKHSKPNFLIKIILKAFVKDKVTNEIEYAKNSGTAPEFIIKDDRNFEIEKSRLINYITKTQSLGKSNFEGKESLSFGVLDGNQWNNMFYKHLDHHLNQFGI